MGSDGRRSGPRPQGEPVCAHCGRPVGTAIKRRKVLGAYVPVWGPAPCRNSACEACVVDEPQGKARAARGYKNKHKRGHPTRRDLKPEPKPAAPEAGAGRGTEPADGPGTVPLVDTDPDTAPNPPLG